MIRGRPVASFVLVALLSASPTAGQTEGRAIDCEDGASLTYLANAAVLLRAGSDVLIDGPFTTGVDPYPRFTPSALDAVRRAHDPFGDVDWLLVTHAHDDHIDPAAAAEHLIANPAARLASTREVVDAVRAEAREHAGVADRLVVAEPVEGRSVVVHPRDPRIEAVTLDHGPGRSVENIGFIVETGGLRLLHVGDSEVTRPGFERLALGGRDLDVALLPTWYVTGSTYRPALEVIGARRTLVVHFPKPDVDDGFVRRLGGWAGVWAFFERIDPEFVPLVDRGATICLDGGSTEGWPGSPVGGRPR